jgi:hypothetical protein
MDTGHYLTSMITLIILVSMMTTTQRVTITERENGFHVRSGRGIYGTHIRVRHFVTALSIKNALKNPALDRETCSAMIDALIRDEPKDGYQIVPASRLHLVWSR